MTCTKTLAWLTSALTRIASVAWIIIAGFAVKQLLGDLSAEYALKGQTLYIPMELCKPTSFRVKEEVINFNNSITNCEPIKFLYNSVAVSLIISMLCVFSHLLVWLIANLDTFCSIDQRILLGMGTFTCFPLAISAIQMWMLFQLSNGWVQDFTPSLDNVTVDGVNIEAVKYVGNMNILLSTAGLGLSLCLFMIVDGLEAILCPTRKKSWSKTSVTTSVAYRYDGQRRAESTLEQEDSS